MRFLGLILGLLCGLFTSPVFADDFSITTTAFLDQAALPVLYTCDGKDISPELTWSNPPAKTQSYALLLTDPDAPGGTWYHWVIYNIPSSTAKLAQGEKSLPTGALAGKNSWDKTIYNGPCPPKGTSHSYVFTLYALDSKLKLPAGTDGKTVLDTIKNHILGKVQLTAIYSRWIK